MALYQLVYQSKAAYAFTDENLIRLLEGARQFNTQYHISGILLYGYGAFMQMLEGDDDVVRSVYHLKIAQDKRHHSLKVLHEGFAKRRLYEHWAMAFRPMDKSPFVNMPGFIDPDEPSEYGVAPLAPLNIMRAMELMALDDNYYGI